MFHNNDSRVENGNKLLLCFKWHLISALAVRYLESAQTVNTGANVTLTCELTGNSWSSGVNISKGNDETSETSVCVIDDQGSSDCEEANIRATGDIDGAKMTVVMAIENASCTDSGQYYCSPAADATARTSTKLTVLCRLTTLLLIWFNVYNFSYM